MTYGVAMAFPLLEPGVLWAEPDAWQALAPYLPLIQTPDMGGPKKHGEWLLAGASYAGTKALPCWEPEVHLGASHKRLRVHGHRRWEGDKLTNALPVSRVFVDWRSTWGGTAVADNPMGCGVRDGSNPIVVPCVECPKHPWTGPDERAIPAGTLPLDVAHPLRQSFVGTYDASYLERFYPGMPADFDHRFFNRAPLDQQIPHMWRGDEAFVLRHWHAEHTCIEGHLPGLRAALHVALRGEALQRVDTGLSTVWLFPNDLFGVLVFEGWIPVHTLDGSDVERVIVGVERLNTPVLSVEHYERLWRLRTERTPKAAAFAMDDSNLCPDGVVTRFAALDAAFARQKPDPALEKMGDRMAQQWELAIERLPKLTPDIDQSAKHVATEPLFGSTAQNLAPVVDGMRSLFHGMAELSKRSLDLQGKKPHEQIEAMERFQTETKQQVKAITAEYETLIQMAAPTACGLTDISGVVGKGFSADPSGSLAVATRLAQGRSSGEPLTISTEELKALSVQLDAQSMRDGWAKVEELIAQNPSQSAAPDEMTRAQRGMERLRKQVAALGDDQADGPQRLAEMVAAYAAWPGGVTMPGKPLDGEDWDDYAQRFMDEAKPPQFQPLNRADLISPDVVCEPGLRLRNRTVGGWGMQGLDLTHATLENVTLIGCDLRDCTLTNSVWSNCTLIGCDLSGAKLDAAQITETRLQWCSLNRADGANSRWESSQFICGLARESDWRSSQWTAVTILETDLSHSDWRSSTLMRHTMLQVPFGETLFSEALAHQSAWIACRLENSVWDGCVLKGCYIGDSNLPTSWRRASLTHVSLRGAALDTANWRDAKMDGVDCSEASMRNCDFSGLQASNVCALSADLRNSKFEGAHITCGIFIDSDLRGAYFGNAILEHSSFGLTRQDDLTDFTDANLTTSNFYPKRDRMNHD